MFGRPECDACIGEQREACGAVFSSVRDQIGQAFLEIVQSDEPDNPILLMEHQDKSKEIGLTAKEKLTELGCKLNPVSLSQAMLSEVSAAVTIGIGDLIEAEEAAEEQRLKDLIEQSSALAKEARELINKTVAEVQDEEEAESMRFCEQQGSDLENLDFAQKMDLRYHLRKEGYIK
jgi:hypothetical protein